MTEKRALVLLSGGQDSTTALFWAQSQGYQCEAVAFDYRQRHLVELRAARKVADIANVPLKFVALYLDHLVTSLNYSIDITVDRETGLPTTFVPGRNLLFLTMAAGIAYQQGIRDLVIGVNHTDFSGYPDCRPAAIAAMEQALQQAISPALRVLAPLQHMEKREIVLMAHKLGPLAWSALAHTHTCYLGQSPPCGECPSCKIRALGFAQAGKIDPLVQA